MMKYNKDFAEATMEAGKILEEASSRNSNANTTTWALIIKSVFYRLINKRSKDPVVIAFYAHYKIWSACHYLIDTGVYPFLNTREDYLDNIGQHKAEIEKLYNS